MGSGLSMSSVNKIKELASAREYGLALELVETQDLSKSLNPQFLRLCGEIYLYNGKYVEARRVLLMAYKIAPQAKRIMYSLMELYLKMGYKKLAKTYFDMYLVDADENAEETKQLRYLYGKANHASPEELVEYLGTTYNENIDYEWSYETFLVYTMLDRQQETLSLALEYTAHYTDAPHCFVVADILEGKVEAEDIFYDDIPECEDDDPAQEESRKEERKLLHAYDLRMNPPEPEIISMVDEREEQRIEFGAKHKRKKLNKEKNESEETDLEEAEATEAAEKKEQEATDGESAVTAEADEEDFDDPLDKRPSFIKKAFSKLRLKGQGKTEEAEEDLDEEPSLEASSFEKSSSEEPSFEDFSVEEPSSEKLSLEELSVEEPSTEQPSFEDFSFENDENDDLSDIEILLASRKSKEEEEEEESFFDDHEDLEDTEEYFEERKNHSDSIVTDDFEGDGFEAEADSVEDFGGETDTKKQEEAPVENENEKPKHKSSILFEAATFADEDEEELPVDDFSSEEEDEFGKMRTGDEDDYDSVFVGEVEVEETKSAEEIYNDVERTFEESDAEEAEDEVEEPVEEIEEATDEPEEAVEEIAEEAVEEVEETAEPLEDETEKTEEAEEPVEEVEEVTDESEEVVEEVKETAEEAVDEAEEPLEETEVVEEAVEEVEEETEESVEEVTDESEEVVEETEEPLEDTIEETEVAEVSVEEVEEVTDEPEKPVEEIEEVEVTEEIEEATEEVELSTETVEENMDEFVDNTESANNAAEDEPWRNMHKSSLDFPVFRSSLFPEYHTASKTDTTVPESKVTSDIFEKEQKLQENLRKEEQIQREAEALLASLGIDLSSSSVKASPTPETTKQKPLSDVSIPVEKTTTIKKEPSRDELKASLKIDSVKRNLLSKLKESR